MASKCPYTANLTKRTSTSFIPDESYASLLPTNQDIEKSSVDFLKQSDMS